MSLHITASGNSRSVSEVQGHKRGRKGKDAGEVAQPNLKGRKVVIDDEFMTEREKAFHEDKVLIIARNAIVNTGYLPISVDDAEVNKINHIFQTSLKGKDVKATNQEQSGRCWMFAGLNTLRHSVIADFNLKNFEFSETYLYFWNKIEDSDRFLQEVIEKLDEPQDNFKSNDQTNYDKRLFDLFETPIQDGAYWNCFANLVDKYGLMPKNAMEESVNSLDSDQMNTQLNSKLREAACFLRKTYMTMSANEIQAFRKTVMMQIYNIVALFLGHPPKEFNWSYYDADGRGEIVRDLNPHSFKDMVLGTKNLSDNFVVLSNYPVESWPFKQVYEVKQDNNMVGGKTHTFLNLPIEKLEKYARKSILKGQPVWFIGDVARGFHSGMSALNESLIKTDLVFGPSVYRMDKGERFLNLESAGVHAMTFTGFNEHEEKPVEWQVENSWGYDVSDEPGLDGFLSASGQWFKDNVFEIVVRKKHLSRRLRKLLDTEAVQLKSWGAAAKRF